MKKFFLLTLFLMAGVFYFQHSSSEFDSFMKKGNPDFEKLYLSPKGKQWKIVKSLYEKHMLAKPSKEPYIPKIIHQIWLGGPLPEKYLPLQKSWIEKHPDWEYHLWTDADIADFPFVYRKRFEEAINVGEKADIFRYEILNLLGGLYVDTDFECIQPVDFLHYRCDLYVGVFGAFAEEQEVAMGNGLIGSIPNHPIIQYCMKKICEKPAGKTADEVQAISGPGCFKRAFFKRYQEKNLRNIALPYTFFYPLPSDERCGHLDETAKARWIQPETLGIHYWDTSWAAGIK